MDNQGTFKNLKPAQLLAHLSSTGDTANLRVSNNLVTWSFYLKHGKIIFASNSVDPFDRLERQMRRLSNQLTNLNSETRAKLRMSFEKDSDTTESDDSEYEAICWLFNEYGLSKTQISALIQELVTEVVESFLLIQNGTYTIENYNFRHQELCQLDLQPIVKRCQEELKIWQSLQPYISSPYQRPYLLLQTKAMQRKFPQLQQELTSWMKGFSLRHLAILLQQEELELAQKLHPYIAEGYVVLHEPDPPFDKLPRNFEKLPEISVSTRELVNKLAAPLQQQQKNQTVATIATKEKVTIVAENSTTTAAYIPVVLQELITAKETPTPDKLETTTTPTEEVQQTILSPQDTDSTSFAPDKLETTTTPTEEAQQTILTPEQTDSTSSTPETQTLPLQLVALQEAITAKENGAIFAKNQQASPQLVETAEVYTQAATESDADGYNAPEVATQTPSLDIQTRTYTIVCVDDSPTMLKELSLFLNEEMFSVVTISNPVKALMAIIRHKPDLILLDVNMDGIDGYELCRLLRNNNQFKITPIVMVTGNTGIFDRVKARLVGASGYLTKPFTRAELLKMVFMHLA
ncbi:MAG: response regulator [Nostocaceae cyanobacterium]|nr:response regulator [Nostocaceae cyanobacterium]